ncbi:MAG: co-chaperone GroES [Patescibacteria group bacterium]
MIKPILDYVVIETVREEKKKGSIILPDTIEKEKSGKGKVVAVGKGKKDSSGKLIPMEVEKGDVVIFKKYSFHEVKIGDKEYLVGSQDGVYGIVK